MQYIICVSVSLCVYPSPIGPISDLQGGDEEELTGLALKVHKSVKERFIPSSKSKKKSAADARDEEEDNAPIILGESEASLVW